MRFSGAASNLWGRATFFLFKVRSCSGKRRMHLPHLLSKFALGHLSRGMGFNFVQRFKKYTAFDGAAAWI